MKRIEKYHQYTEIKNNKNYPETADRQGKEIGGGVRD